MNIMTIAQKLNSYAIKTLESDTALLEWLNSDEYHNCELISLTVERIDSSTSWTDNRAAWKAVYRI